MVQSFRGRVGTIPRDSTEGPYSLRSRDTTDKFRRSSGATVIGTPKVGPTFPGPSATVTIGPGGTSDPGGHGGGVGTHHEGLPRGVTVVSRGRSLSVCRPPVFGGTRHRVSPGA